MDVKGTTSFTYDDLNRLESITEPDGTVTGYAYDVAGNPDGKTANNEVTTTSYDYNAQNRLTGNGGGPEHRRECAYRLLLRSQRQHHGHAGADIGGRRNWTDGEPGGTAAGAVVSKIPVIAIAGAAAGVMVDCQKYDGVTAVKAATITVASTILTVGAGAAATFFGAPVVAAALIGIAVGTVAGMASNYLKTKYCG